VPWPAAYGNGIAELILLEYEPIDCEVVIPVNMMLNMSVEEAIESQVEQFRNPYVHAKALSTRSLRITQPR
jgi:hypothetical protein